ncbi:PP2C family protein-serine/threonine phosphatase [Falsiroseomonas selenitidurans]|uniref:Serine/threonine-protein phosphatase n=1 Tax=Falsiroseomonas selenitidurans TaxID=2716335 RepID=A0ABX1EBF0_9PROT|nr:protein phosphatase 2C domain-containing protein [Falsiroseomonas selenitidurans]NKC34565.1 serine/threonine-protein phosphatase [Falsiroseomonas selenitidurans]
MNAVLTSQAVTHRGTVRPRNEDAFVDRPDIGLWAVADGAGGHGAGDVASAAATAALQDLPPGLSAAEMLAQVRLRITAVHADLQRQAQQAGPGRIIATTLAVLLARGGHYACLWAGDSRIYRLREGSFTRLTRDHSLVQDLVDQGLLDEAAAESHPQANVITRAVGAEGVLELDKASARLAPGDRFLLCSDGLFKAVPEGELGQMLADGFEAEVLIRAALAYGARDNVTAIIVRA